MHSREEDKTRVSMVSKIADRRLLGAGVACLVQIYGKDIGRKYQLDEQQMTIGRGPDNGVIVDMDNVSRHHCSVTVTEQGHFIEDMGSTNGTFVNDIEVMSKQGLRNGDFIKVGGVIFKFIGGDNIEQLYYEEIYRMAIIDGLTQAYNKRYLLEFIEREMSRCKRYQRPLSIMMFDLDHFKRINDDYGHLAGDFVLKRMSDLVQTHAVRKEECFARYGGEEFALVLPDTELERAAIAAEKVRELISAERFEFEDNVIPVSTSIGVALMQGSDTPETFIARADACLYDAKRNGRNRVVS